MKTNNLYIFVIDCGTKRNIRVFYLNSDLIGEKKNQQINIQFQHDYVIMVYKPNGDEYIIID